MSRAAARSVAFAALLAGLVACVAVFWGCAVQLDASTDVRSQVPGIELMHTPAPFAAWSPDSRVIAYQTRGAIKFEHSDGAAAGEIKAPPLGYEFDSPEPLRFSADGRHLFYVTNAGPGRSRQIRGTQVRRHGGGVEQTPIGTELADAAFAEHGWPLVYTTGPYEFGLHNDRHGPPAAAWELSGPGAKPRRLMKVDGIPTDPVVGSHSVLFRAWRDKRFDLWSVGLDGSDPRRLARFELMRGYAFAPKGQEIAFAAAPRNWRAYLYVLTPGQAHPHRISRAKVNDGPIWSPDGRWLVFSTTEGEIRRVHPDGSGETTIADFDGEEVEWLALSPDGRRLLYGAHPPPSDSLGYGGNLGGED